MSQLYLAKKKHDPLIYCVSEEEKQQMINSHKYKNTVYKLLTEKDIEKCASQYSKGKIRLVYDECPEDHETHPESGKCVQKCAENIQRDKITGNCSISKGKIEIKIKNNIIDFIHNNNLPTIYLNNKDRVNLSENINSGLTKIHSLKSGKQCIMSKGKNKLSKYLKVGKLLGTGDWGNVYTGCLPVEKNGECTDKSFQFAIKMSRITPESLKDPYNPNNSAWHEVLIMKNILTPIVENNICPNVPLLMDSFICDNCSFILRDERQEHPCIIMITELAGGDFNHFVDKTDPNDKEIYSALFQIMAGIHATQKFGQIMNYDVKGANILYFNVEAGGYWHYVIHGKDFYVPNYGKMFVLNDFGVSQTFSPDFQMSLNKKDKEFELGSRYAMDIGGKFYPIEATQDYIGNGDFTDSYTVKWSKGKKSRGSQYMLVKSTQEIMDSKTTLTKKQLKFLKKHNLSSDPLSKEYFLNPLVIPPMEYYNDTQDAIRMFIGGDRTTQRGDHSRPKVVTDDIFKKISYYNGQARKSEENYFSTNAAKTMAGRFLEQFFTRDVNYTKKLSGKNHGDYIMSKY